MAIGTQLKGGVYRIEIGPNFYFGSSIYLEKRRRSHYADLCAGRHPNRRMQAAFNKYQEFEFVIVGRCEDAAILGREQRLLDQFFKHPRCMNLAPTAGNSAGVEHSVEARQKMSEAHIGLMVGMFHPLYGTKRPEHTRQKIAAALLGTKKTKQAKKNHLAAMRRKSTRLACSRAATGRRQSAEQIEKRIAPLRGPDSPLAKKVWLYHPSFGQLSFQMIKHAASFLGVRSQQVSQWLSGAKQWPGSGRKMRTALEHLNGLKGGYI